MRFRQLQRDPNAVLRKILYKSGKSLAIKATVAFAGGIMLTGASAFIVKADTAPATQSVSGITTSDSTDSQGMDDQGNTTDNEVGATASSDAQKITNDTPEKTAPVTPTPTIPSAKSGDVPEPTVATNYIHYLKPDGTPFLKDDGSPAVMPATAPIGTHYPVPELYRAIGHVVEGYYNESVTNAPYTDMGGVNYVIIGNNGKSFNVTAPELHGNEKLNIYEQNEDGTNANGDNSEKTMEIPVNGNINSPYKSSDFASGRTLDLDNSTVQWVMNDGSYSDYIRTFSKLMTYNGDWNYGLKTNLNDFVSAYLKYTRIPGYSGDNDGLKTINIIGRYKDSSVSNKKVKFIVEYDDEADDHALYTTPADEPLTGLAGTVPNISFGEVGNHTDVVMPLTYSKYPRIPGYTNDKLIFTNRLTDDEGIQTYHVYVQKLLPLKMEFRAIDDNGKTLITKVFTKEVHGDVFTHAYTYDGNGKLISSKEIKPVLVLYNHDDESMNTSQMAEFKKNYFYDDWITNKKLDIDNPRSAEWYLTEQWYYNPLKNQNESNPTLDSLINKYTRTSEGDDNQSNNIWRIDLVYDAPSSTSSHSSSSSSHHRDNNVTDNVDNEATIVKKNQTVATTTKIVNLYDKDGNQVTNRALGINTGWYSDEEYTIDGVMYYRVATNEFAKSDDVYVYVAQDPTFVRVYNNENGDLINYKDSTVSRSLKPSSEWKTDRIAIIDGQDYYRVATNEFVPVGEVYEYSYVNTKVTTDAETPVYNERGVELNIPLPANTTYKADRLVTINNEQYYRIATNEFVKTN